MRFLVSAGHLLAVDKRKILESARKLSQKGAKAKALKEYQKLIKLDPKDAKLRLELGDAYRRWGEVSEAITAYSKVAEQYMKEGFDARAVAVFKQIHNLDPDRLDSYVPLAELYQRMGLNAEAITALQTAADGYHKAGQRLEALDVLRKMATVDPANTTSRIKVADLLRREELIPEAIAEYEAVASELEGQNDAEAFEGVLKRIIELEPDRIETLTRLARSLSGRGAADAAQSYAERIVEAQPDEPEHYELLAEIYRSAGREDALSGVYTKLADLLDRRGDSEKARDIRQRYVSTEGLSSSQPEFGSPSDDLLGGDAIGGDDLGFAESSTLVGDGESGILQESELAESVSLETGDISELLADDILDEVADEPLSLEEIAVRPVPADFDPDQMLAEASVYLRYGKKKEAIENLEAILGRDAGHRGALEKLGEAFADGGENERAIQAWRSAIERARADGDEPAISALEGRISALDGGESIDSALGGDDPLDLSDTIGSDFEDESDDSELDLEPDADGDGTDLDDEGDVVDVDMDLDVELELDVDNEIPMPAVAAGASEAPAPISAEPAQIDEKLEEADFFKQQGLLDEAEQMYRSLLEGAPDHPVLLARLGEIAAERGADAGSEDTEVDLGDVEIDVDLDGLDENVAESAEVEIEDTEDLSDFVEEISSPEPEAPAAEAAPGSEFDLAAELTEDANDSTGSGSSGTVDDGFSAVFSAFKKGVSEALSDGDHEAHYDLGIAYREMELWDDAMDEFRMAMQSPKLRVDSLHMLGVCSLDRGQPADAVAHLEQALAIPDANPGQQLAVRYELGRAFEGAGDRDRARAAWEAVAAADPNFCDVGEYLAKLDDNGAKVTVAGPSPESEYESFDDLISEANADFPTSDPGASSPTVPDPGNGSSGASDASSGRKKKKKKISFA